MYLHTKEHMSHSILLKLNELYIFTHTHTTQKLWIYAMLYYDL